MENRPWRETYKQGGPQAKVEHQVLHEQMKEGDTTLDMAGPTVFAPAISLGLCTLGATVESDSKCKLEQEKI